MTWIDLEREKEINIGVDWPYPDLASDECLLTINYQEENEGLEVGDKISIISNQAYLW